MGLPLFMLKGLQMRPGIKLAFSGVFSLAIITIIFDIVRVIESFVEEGVAGTVPLFTNLESAVAVVVSCLPSYVSLMRARTRSSADKHGGAPYQERPLAVTGSARQLMNTKESMNTKDSFCSNDKDFPLIAPEV